MDADVDVAVVGGGVVGCAVASVLSRAGRRVVLLEAGKRLGGGVTSRNNGVIHSGLYYSRGSLKAQTCVRGNALLYEWAQNHGVPRARAHRTGGRRALVPRERYRRSARAHALVRYRRSGERRDGPGGGEGAGDRARRSFVPAPYRARTCPRRTRSQRGGAARG